MTIVPLRSFARRFLGLGLSAPAGARSSLLPLWTAFLLGAPSLALSSQDGDVPSEQHADTSVIADALASVSDEVRVYNDHLTILASPWMEGRLPGTRGMELAMEYMEFHFAKYGLEAPFGKELENEDGTIAIEAGASYRQPFLLRASSMVTAATIGLTGGAEDATFEHGALGDFTVTSFGKGGEVTAPAVFIGYSIENGPDGFTSFPEGLDLSGKVAVMLRFEPIGENGWSQWEGGRERWSRRASFTNKLRDAADRGAEAVIIINPPGSADARAGGLLPPGGGSRSMLDIPVMHMSTEAGERLVHRAYGSDAVTLRDLRDEADAGPMATELPGRLHLHATIEKVQPRAENVVGVLRGKGSLADEYIVVGAHLDHLGMGAFGSGDQLNAGRKLHPGADDNASGSAGIILIAEKLSRAYREAESSNLRSVVFIGFSAEESGLHGSDYYVENPVAPIAQHKLMMNFDMIGRITQKKLSLSGLDTGVGLSDFVAPIAQANPLDVVTQGSPGGASDHTKFESAKIPVLFAIIEIFHKDYHTPRDVSSLINRVDAVHAANLFYELALQAAQRTEAFAFQPRGDRPSTQQRGARGAQRRATSRVRLGVRLAVGGNLEIESVVEGSTAFHAGLQPGDRIVEWNGRKITDLMGSLSRANPGDEVVLTVIRGGKRTELTKAALQAKEGAEAPKSDGPKSDGKGPEGASKAPAEAEEAASGDRPGRAAGGVMFGIRPAYTDDGSGVLAESVTEGSPAEEAGLQAGDRLLTWNGEEVEGARALGALLKTGTAGSEITVTIERDEKVLTKTVTLRAR